MNQAPPLSPPHIAQCETLANPTQRIADILFNERFVVRRNETIENERGTAIFDLLQENYFAPVGCTGPYQVQLVLEDNRLVFELFAMDQTLLRRLNLSLAEFRGVIKDYFLICESYYEAVKRAPRSHIEDLDMTRRSIHNEGSKLLMERMAADVVMDFATARRLFTLICVLHIRG